MAYDACPSQQKNTLCKEEINSDDQLFNLYNIIKNLYLCDPNYVESVFNKIKKLNNNDNFLRFLEYFESQYNISYIAQIILPKPIIVK